MDNETLLAWELDLLNRGLTVLAELLACPDERIQLQAVKCVLRLCEVLPPAELLASPGVQADAGKWRGFVEGLEGVEGLTQT